MGPHEADDATPRFPVKAHVPHEVPRALKAEAPCPSSARSMAPIADRVGDAVPGAPRSRSALCERIKPAGAIPVVPGIAG